MPVETATYLNQLNITYPTHTDGLDQADSHLRLIKDTLLNTFPNMGTVVTASPTDLNNIIGLQSNGTVTVPIPSGSTLVGGEVVLKAPGTLASAALVNNGGTLQFTIGGVAVATLDSAGNLSTTGSLNSASIKKGGYELLPSGCILQWSGSVASIPSGWHLCDGTTGTPDLRNQFILGAGGSYAPGATGGSLAPTITVAAAATGLTMGSAGSHNHTGAVGSYSLTIADLPAHNHSVTLADPGHVHAEQFGSGSGGSYSNFQPVPAAPAYYPSAINTMLASTGITIAESLVGSNNPHSHSVTADGVHVHTLTDPTHVHTAAIPAPPYYALCFIMKL